MRLEPIAAHLASRLEPVRAWSRTPEARRLGWIVALILFFGGLAMSLKARPDLFASVQFGPLVPALLALVVVMTLANTFTVREIGRLAGARLTTTKSFSVAVMSAAANYLPVPGGPIYRVVAMQQAGAGLKAAGFANIAAGLIWMAATFLLAGLCAALITPWLGASLLLAAAVLGCGSIWMAHRLPGGNRALLVLFIISVAAACIYALAVHLALAMIGAEASLVQSTIVSAAGVIGAAIALTPSGVGIREGASAGLAALVGVDPAAAFAASAVVHVMILGFLMLCAAGFAGTQTHKPLSDEGLN